MPKEKVRPEPEKDKNGYRILTKKFICDLCEYNGGYKYPHLNKNCYLHFMGFHKIEGLDDFINLRVLYLEGNRIEKIEGLSGLVSLTCLYLQNNYIKNIEGLEANKNLVILNLSGNQIKKIENVGCCEKLENFYIEKNEIATAEDLEGVLECKKLTLLDIQNNKLESGETEVLEVLSKIPQLRVIYFKGNDIIRNITNYRRTMIVKMEHLTYLDDRPVREEDRIGAKAYLEGGYEAEVKARQDYKALKEGKDPEKVRERERNKETYEEKKRKALENLKNMYEKKKNELEDKKKQLMKEYEENPDKRDALNLQLSSVDYQLEENEKFKTEEEENVAQIIQSKKMIGGDFEYEPWMDEVIENEVTDNFFDFSRALSLIKLEFKNRGVKNYDSFKLLDLRSKWTEFELKKYRKDTDGTVYHYTKEDLFPEEEKPPQEEEKDSQIKIQEASIDENNLLGKNKSNKYEEEEIDTSLPKKNEDLSGLD